MGLNVVECPGCQAKLRFQSRGKRVALNCPKCGQKIAFSTNESDGETASAASPRRPTGPKPENTKRASRPVPSRKMASRADGDDDRPVRKSREPRQRPRSGTQRGRETAGANQRQRQSSDRTSPAKGIIIAAAVGIPLLLCVIGAVFWLGGNDNVKPSPSEESTPAIAQTPPVVVPDLPPADQQEPDEPAPRVAAAPSQPNPIPRDRPPVTRQPPAAKQPPIARRGAGNEKGLRYRWIKGDQHVYALTVEADRDGSKSIVRGSCTYTVKGVTNDVQESESSGTGFVVGTDGYIATCAHVVEDATHIEVTLDGRKYAARVLFEDAKKDLAVIKIDARRLNVLSFGDSDRVQLLQEIQAFGFPLSTLLGTGLKANSGKVAGTVDLPEHGRQIQIDAPINPGNSGGPVMNNEGQVVGIASSKLVNSVATAVGFAVPVNELKTILGRLGVAVPGSGSGEKLEGVQLAAMAKPSVAFIKVESASGGEVFDIGYTASFSQTERSNRRNRIRIGPPSFPTTERAQGNIRVTSLGQIVGFSGDGSLPHVLGSIGQMFIDPLNENGQAEWGGESDGAVSIVQRGENGPFSGIPGFGRRGFGPRGFPGSPFSQPADKTLQTIPAKERVDYRLGQEVGNRISIHKTYQFITSDSEQNPYLAIRGKGELVFDKTLGMPAKYDYTGTLVQTDKSGSKRMPLSVKFVLRDPEEVKREHDEAQTRAIERKRIDTEKRNVPSIERVDALVDKIEGDPNSGGIWVPLKDLVVLAVVPERRDTVLAIAKRYLNHSNAFASASAAHLIAKWGTEDQIDLMRDMLKNKDHMRRAARAEATQKLVDFNDTESFEYIVAALTDTGSRSATEKVIIAAGQKMEQPVLDQLARTSDHFTLKSIIKILSQIGTEKSIEALENISKTNRSRIMSREAQKAIATIKTR